MTQTTNFTDKYRILAKRIGDASQAIAGLQDAIPYNRLINPAGPLRQDNVAPPPDTQMPLMTNGNHMFASYDRIAIVQALKFKAPIVFYDQPKGDALIFVSKDLTTICQKYAQMRPLDASLAPGAAGRMGDLSDYLHKYGKEAMEIIATVEKWAIESRIPSALHQQLAAGAGQGSPFDPTGAVCMSPKWPQPHSPPLAGCSFAQYVDELLRLYVGGWWAMAPLITGMGSISADLDRTMGSGVGEVTVQTQLLLKVFIEHIQAMYSSGLLSTVPRAQDYIEQVLPVLKTLHDTWNIQDWVAVANGMNQAYAVMQAVKATLDVLDACRLTDDQESLLQASLKSYRDMVDAIEDRVRLLEQLGRNDIPLLRAQWTEERSRLCTVPPDAADNYNHYRQLIAMALPKNIASTLSRLTPLNKSREGTGRVRRPKPTWDDLQREFGEMFYQQRNSTYQIDTLLRPLWDVVSESNLTLRAKSALSVTLQGFAKGTRELLETWVSADHATPAAVAMATSAETALQDMLRVPEDAGQAGGGMQGGAPPGSTEAAASQLTDALRRGGELDPAQLYTLAQVAETLDNFYRMLASILYSQMSTVQLGGETTKEGRAVLSQLSITLKGPDAHSEPISTEDLLNRLGKYLLPDYNPADFPAENLAVQGALEKLISDEEQLEREGPPRPEYIFNALGSQLENYKEILADNTNFIELFPKYIETIITTKKGQPLPYPELQQEFDNVFNFPLAPQQPFPFAGGQGTAQKQRPKRQSKMEQKVTGHGVRAAVRQQTQELLRGDVTLRIRERISCQIKNQAVWTALNRTLEQVMTHPRSWGKLLQKLMTGATESLSNYPAEAANEPVLEAQRVAAAPPQYGHARRVYRRPIQGPVRKIAAAAGQQASRALRLRELREMGGGKTLRKRKPRKRTIRKNKKAKRSSSRGKGKKALKRALRRTRNRRVKGKRNNVRSRK